MSGATLISQPPQVAYDTDAEYPDTDVDQQTRNRYGGGGGGHQPSKSRIQVEFEQNNNNKPINHHDHALTADEADDDDQPPPLEDTELTTVTAPTRLVAGGPAGYSSTPGNPNETTRANVLPNQFIGGAPLSDVLITQPHLQQQQQQPLSPEQFQQQQNALIQQFQLQQRALLQQMSTPEYLAETDRLFNQLPLSIQTDLTTQLNLVPVGMRVVGRGQMTRQAIGWSKNPNQTFLTLGVKRNNMALVRMCLEELGADVNYVDEEGNCGLHWAVWYKIAPMAEYLISRQANVDIPNSKGQTPIHWACMGGNLSCVRVLVKARCHLDVQDKDGYYPTHAAAQHGKTAVLEYLKLNGADLHAVDGSNRTILHWAAFKNELITTQYLVNQGLSLSHKDTGGRLALHWAASQNNLDIVSYLVGVMEEAGDFSALDCKDLTLGATPREVAVAKNAHRVVNYLYDVEARLKQSKFQKLFQKMFCLNQQNWFSSKVANDTTKNKLGLYITIWFHSMLLFSSLHHWFFMAPYLPESAVSASLSNFLIFAEILACLGWLLVHNTDPGYLPKNLDCPWVDTCIGAGNHHYFVLFLIHMILALSLFGYVCIRFLMVEENRTFWNVVFSLLTGGHAIFMVLYTSVLLGSQGPIIFENLTTNEQMNGWRYKYMTKEIGHDPKKGRGFTTPFDEGRIKNCLAFFRLRAGKEVTPTVEMAQSNTDGPIVAAHMSGASSSGGVQLPAAAFDWDGVEQLQQGIIVTPENEQQVYGILRYLAFQKAMNEQAGEGGAHGHSHGGGGGHQHGGGGGHGHSHGGKECHGHN